MTLDEAIKHCEEKAEEKKKEADYLDAPYGMDTSERTSCLECANDHLQLAQWLKELKTRREADMTKNCFGCNGDRDFGCENCLNKSKGDLISREALKKKCAEEVKSYNNSDFIPCPTWNKAMDLINDAPTVKAYTEEEVQEIREEVAKEFKDIIDNAPTVCGNNPKWCESCVSKGKCASTRPQVAVFTESTDEKAISELKTELQNIIKARQQDEWTGFANFVAEWVTNDNFFEENADIFAELACRKLVKLGIVDIDGDTYKLKEE